MLLLRIDRPVDEVDLLGGAGEGGVEPAVVVDGREVGREVALVEVDAAPLSALRLVAGGGIGILAPTPPTLPLPAGLIGFLSGCVFIVLSVITTPAPFGRSYFWPLIPFNREAMRSVLFRYPAKRKQPPQIWNRK